MDARYGRLPEVPRSEPILPPASPQELPSSPPSVAASDAGGIRRKPKKPPPVTPRSFRRFFTPRSMLNGAKSPNGVRTSRQALGVLSSRALNRLGPAFTRSSKLAVSKAGAHQLDPLLPPRTPSRKRKLSFSSVGSPLQSSPLRKVRIRSPVHDDRELNVTVRDLEVEAGPRTAQSRSPARSTPVKKPVIPVAPIRRSQTLRTVGNLYMRSVLASQMERVTLRANCGTGWQDLTSGFYSRPDDSHSCVNHTRDGLAMPWCVATCNTNSLVAVGDEGGSIRLLDSAENDKMGFSKPYLTFRPHGNSITDLDFSSDDMLLATASGDQTSMVIDMATQQPIYCLANHTSSLKRVQFQPASNNKVLATSSRDGNVNIWDLRCKGFEQPALQVRCSLESESEQSSFPMTAGMIYPQVLNTIYAAHGGMPSQAATSDAQAGRSGVTVTSLAFLPPGRENLFVTSCEASACVRLWDLRTAHSNRRGRPVLPLSTTREPDSHVKYRRFGLTSLALGGDGSRLFTLCRDGTVYAYSTSHLILGHAPELLPNTARPRWCGGSDKQGLGPLYGFRHSRLRVASFYVKLAIRKACHDKPEMLAVGSTDHCAVVFPTDEKFLEPVRSATPAASGEQRLGTPLFSTLRSGLRRTNSGVGLSGRIEDNIPIYQSGTPLIQGHEKEVSAVAWTPNGELISVSDDHTARCWREGPAARDLRKGGDANGSRWQCGWADTKDSYDDEDE